MLGLAFVCLWGGVWLMLRLSARPGAAGDALTYDFGRVPEGTSVRHVFDVENRSDSVLQIGSIRCSCACLSHEVVARTIAPRGKLRVPVRLDTWNLAGKVHYSCIVASDVLGVTKLTLVGQVCSRTAFFSPAEVRFGKVVVGRTPAATIQIANPDYSSRSWRVVGVQSENRDVVVRHSEKDAQIACTIRSDAPIGEIKGRVLVMIETPDGQVTARLPLSGKVVGLLEAVPESIFLGTLGPGEPYRTQFTVTVTDSSRAPAGIVPSEGITLTQTAAGAYCCVLNGRAPADMGPFGGEVCLSDGATKRDLVRVRYAGLVRQPGDRYSGAGSSEPQLPSAPQARDMDATSQ